MLYPLLLVSLALTRDEPASDVSHVMGNKFKVNDLNVAVIKLVVKVCSEPASNTNSTAWRRLIVQT